MKIKMIYWIWLGAMMLASCDKEDDLTPSGEREDYFSVSASDTIGDPEAALRYRFYSCNKVHLLFNDTLQHEQRGTYADGTPYWFTEVIDLPYTIESTGSGLRFLYLTDLEDQKKGAEFVEKYILPHVSGEMRPYSVFLVEKLEQKKESKWKIIDYYAGRRCLAVNVASILEMDDEEEIAEWSTDLFYYMIISKINSWDKEALEEFYAVCAPYYDEYYTTYAEELGWSKKPTNEQLLELGFIGGPSGSFFEEQEEDFENYMDALFYWEEDEPFEEYYAGYAKVLRKYEILRNIIEDHGYKFNRGE